MLKIAITGNIASGKSLFEACLLKALKNTRNVDKIKILCLDEVTFGLYQNSAPLKEFLLKNFNTEKKEEVSKIVFKDKKLLKSLEGFIYPLILEKMDEFFNENKNSPVLFVSAALLFEAGFNKYFDKIIFVLADENIRLERLIKRNNLTKDEAMVRIKSQNSEDVKKQKCDFIVDNSGTVDELQKAAEDIIKALNIL